MSWLKAITLTLRIVDAIISYLQRQNALKEAEDAVIAKQTLAIFKRLKSAEAIDKRIAALPISDVDRLLMEAGYLTTAK